MGWLAGGHAPGAVVLPCTDEAPEMVARNRSRLLDLGYRPIELDGEVALLALDKHRTYVAAAQLGIPAPRRSWPQAGRPRWPPPTASATPAR